MYYVRPLVDPLPFAYLGSTHVVCTRDVPVRPSLLAATIPSI